jgi:UDP-N-acetylmuramyl pentapeptide phosphotransferase/UDP-N-acetylglucosamine-1-phosphate transferase
MQTPATYLPAVFALLVAAAGWFYLFYSRGAQRLSGIENAGLNHQRTILRRIGGLVMFLLAIAFYAGFYTVDADRQPHAFMAVWLAVLVLLGAVMLLGLVDLRMTWKLRRKRPVQRSYHRQDRDEDA